MSATSPNRRRAAGAGTHGTDARTVWSLLILTLVLVALLVGAALVYVTWRHPSLAGPLGVALAGITLLATIIIALLRR